MGIPAISRLGSALLCAFILQCLPGSMAAEAEADGLDYMQLKTLAMDGSRYYQAAFSIVCRRGDLGSEPDYESAIKWAKEAAKAKEPLGLYSLAVIEDASLGVQGDQAKAAALFKESAPGLEKLASSGDFRSQYALGYMNFSGKGVSQDKAKAAGFFEKAAKAGDEEASFMLGSMYSKGDGVARDASSAVEWLSKAAGSGSARAQLELGMMYLRGGALGQNLYEGAKWLLKAAEKGNPDAQYLMGALLESGRMGEKDMSKALQYYHRSALQGNVQAKKRLKDFAEDMRKTLGIDKGTGCDSGNANTGGDGEKGSPAAGTEPAAKP